MSLENASITVLVFLLLSVTVLPLVLSWILVSSQPKRSLRVGGVLVLLSSGVFGGWVVWENTRDTIPVDMPISLKNGSVGPIKVQPNISESYEVVLTFDNGISLQEFACLAAIEDEYIPTKCTAKPETFYVVWTLQNVNGTVVGRGKSNDIPGGYAEDKLIRSLGFVRMKSGQRYKLQLSQLKIDRALLALHPRLRLEVTPLWGEGQSSIFLALMAICGVSFLTGAFLLVRGFTLIGRKMQSRAEILPS